MPAEEDDALRRSEGDIFALEAVVRMLVLVESRRNPQFVDWAKELFDTAIGGTAPPAANKQSVVYARQKLHALLGHSAGPAELPVEGV